MGKMKKKNTSGEAVAYLSRKQAMKKLQVNLPVFKRICILKGIYPQEPKSRKKAGKGSYEPKVYYNAKDIKFLLHEPLLEKLRQLRSYSLKIKKAREKKDICRVRQLRVKKPRYHLIDLVRERYPTKEDALRDMNDGLNLIFLFARLPKLAQFNVGLIGLSRRLVVEFLNLIIAKQALRKVFISIKGFYVQVELDDIEITWIMPHNLGCHIPTEVDFRTLATCLEFDTTAIGCLLKRLYNESNLVYPPKLKRNVEEDFIDEDYCTPNEATFEFLSSLSLPLKRLDEDTVINDANEHMEELQAMDDNFSVAMAKQNRINSLQRLFRGKRFFLNREVPREVMCFVIRCCGGNVSWDKLSGPGSTYQEEDQTIHYQIIDRPINGRKTYITRNYVQPQWIIDSINACRLMPVQDYLPGVILPPHLSPFSMPSSEGKTGYQPPETEYLRGLVTLEQIREGIDREAVTDSDDGDLAEEEEDIEDEDSEDEVKDKNQEKNSKISVQPGKMDAKATVEKRQEVAKNAERKLREIMLPKKHKDLYKKMVYSIKRDERQKREMTEKRKSVDIQKSKAKKKRKA